MVGHTLPIEPGTKMPKTAIIFMDERAFDAEHIPYVP